MSGPNKTDTTHERVAGCIDVFAYSGFDIMLQKETAPEPTRQPRWYLYQYGKYVGVNFATDTEAMEYADAHVWNT